MRSEPWWRVLDALGDPTRRVIFQRLSREAQCVGDLARGLPVTRSAVSQHLNVLKGVGLVSVEADGSRRIYSADVRGLGPLGEWVRAHLDGADQPSAATASRSSAP